ncbi:MAG TPA: PDZ domain-containing protein [Thermoanaerobaculia bacterium]|nr:PDZ domain-containing protein [Thermoanaerobaculia bacterium]
MKTNVYRAAAVGLMALLGSGAGAWALPGDDKGKDEKKVVEKRRIVIVDGDGKERVIEGMGPMVRRGYLGIGLTELTPELRTHFGAPEDAGVMVSHVEPGGPADKAGLEVGDILARIDGKDVRASWDVRAQVRDFEEGQQVPLEVWRNRKAQTLTAAVTLRERPELDMGPLFMRGEGEDGPLVLRLNGERGGLPERIELPPHGTPGPGPDGEVIRFHQQRSPRERQLEQRLQELEKRIQELEKQLEKRR